MSAFNTLISADELAERLDHCVIIDCRHDLFNPDKGIAEYRESHVPGAFYLSIDHDLSSAKGDGHQGRHPLPDAQALRERLAQRGLADGRQLIAYDADNGSFAGRLWWLARWLGHAEVAVLDGGLRAWREAGYPLTQDVPALPSAPARLTPRPALEHPVSIEDLMSDQGPRQHLVVDARAPERYRGEVEPIDPVAGHIPGALNRPFVQNLRPDGRFKPAPILRGEFEALLAGRAAEAVVHSCGSGVTACHNLLAMRHAGLSGARLFAGSWSAWCADPGRPVARGAEPG